MSRNLKRLIEACLTLDIDMPLVIVGKKAWLWEDELGAIYSKEHTSKQRFHIERKIRVIDYVPVSDLPALYTGAQCLAFPSLYEGFGLPPVEAMSMGCPVVTSSVSSLPEICGDAALYADPYDTMDISNKLSKILDDTELQKRLIKAGHERAEYFSMENYMKRLTEAYRRVL